MEKIIMKPVGVIRTPFSAIGEIPIQTRFAADYEGKAIINDEFTEGLKDLDGFSHVYLLYHFHQTGRVDIVGTPFLENVPHGIFAIRSPHRPNHIGLSLVEIISIEGAEVHFKGPDMLDGTPLLDIKPYVKYFDNRPDSKTGWIEKHLNK